MLNSGALKRALGKERRELANLYRALRREGKSQLARHLYKQMDLIAKAVADVITKLNLGEDGSHQRFTKH